MKVAKFLLFFMFTCNVCAWRIFHRGRSVGGNLGIPAATNKTSEKFRVAPNSVMREEWFPQNLDHFNPGDGRIWSQRYYINIEHYNQSVGGPVFLMIGGEGEASEKWMTQGAWIDYATRFGALCFQLEHRYYGKSYPTKDTTTKNLQYLTSQQALADLATFIVGMNEKYQLPSETKWIAFGGSYPGSLAAWLRAKYPHLVHGAVSASGPLLAQVDFKNYFKVVDDALSAFNTECSSAVKAGTGQIDVLLKDMPGQRNINEKFRLCDPIEKSNSNDISNFYETLAGNFAGVVQYNKDNRFGNNTKGVNITIDTLCNIMTNENLGLEVNRLAIINSLLLNTYDQKCLDYKYDKMINENRNTSWSSAVAEGGRQWTYQTCTEFGFFQSSSYEPQIFGNTFPVEFFIQQCIDIFGPKYNEIFLSNAVNRTNIFYGAFHIEATNIVFVHGSIDPWHALGITTTLHKTSPAIFIVGTAHCADMYPKRDDDLPALTAAREEIAALIDIWISSE